MQPRKTFYSSFDNDTILQAKRTLSPPPHSRKEQQQEFLKTIMTALTIIFQGKGGDPNQLILRQKSLKESSQKTFVTVLAEISREMLGQPLDLQSLPDFAKLMGYPLAITKSWIMGIGLQHSWVGNLGFLSWLSQLYTSSVTWQPFGQHPSIRRCAQSFLIQRQFNQHLSQVQKDVIKQIQRVEQAIRDLKEQSQLLSKRKAQLEEDQPALQKVKKQKMFFLKEQEKLGFQSKQIEKDLKKTEALIAKKAKANQQLQQQNNQLTKKKDLLLERVNSQEITAQQLSKISLQISSLNNKLERLNSISQSNQKTKQNHRQILQKQMKEVLDIHFKILQGQSHQSLIKLTPPRSAGVPFPIEKSKDQVLIQLCGTSNLKHLTEQWRRLGEHSVRQSEQASKAMTQLKLEEDRAQQDLNRVSNQIRQLSGSRQVIAHVQSEFREKQELIRRACESKDSLNLQLKKAWTQYQEASAKLTSQNSALENLALQIAELKRLGKWLAEESQLRIETIKKRGLQLSSQWENSMKNIMLQQIQAEQQMDEGGQGIQC